MSKSSNAKLYSIVIKNVLILSLVILLFSLFGCSKSPADMIETALGEIQSGNLLQAIQTLEEITEKHGDSPEAAIAHYYLSQCYWKTQQYDKSIKSLQIAKAKTPPAETEAITKLQFELMNKYFALKKYEEGEKIAETLLENENEDLVTGVKIQLVGSKMAQDKYDEAKEIIEPYKTSENVQLKRQAYMYLANIHMKTEEYELAREDYDALIASATEDKDPKEEEMLNQLSQEERDKQTKDLVLRLEFEKLVTYGAAKDFDTAIEKMKEFAQKNKGHEYEAIANIAIGDFYQEMENAKEAEKYYRIAADKYMEIGATQDDVERQAGLKVKSGEVYLLKLDEPEKAKEIFNDIIEKYAATRWAGRAQQNLARMEMKAKAADAESVADVEKTEKPEKADTEEK